MRHYSLWMQIPMFNFVRIEPSNLSVFLKKHSPIFNFAPHVWTTIINFDIIMQKVELHTSMERISIILDFWEKLFHSFVVSVFEFA